MFSTLPVTLYPSRHKLFWLLLLMLTFVVLGGILISLEIDVLWGWITVGFFGVGATVMALQFHPQSSYMTLDIDEMIVCSLFRCQHYDWRYIEGFGTYCLSHNNFVGWNFTDDYPQRGRGLAISKGICGFEAGLPETYGLSAAELCTLLNNLLTYLRENTTMDD
jgi:hypothetical protein